MKEKRALYYIESAPQLLSAYRHIQQNCISKFDMIVRLNGSSHNDRQIDQVIVDLGIRQLGHLIVHRLGFCLICSLMVRAILGKYDEHCIADIRSLVGLTSIALSRCKRLVLLDDGTASFDFYQDRMAGLDGLGRRSCDRFIGRVGASTLNRIILHTILPLRSVKESVVERNHYQFQSNDTQRNFGIDLELAIFIGSKVVEAGVCSEVYFSGVIRKFIEKFRNMRLVYIAHREEDLKKFVDFPEISVIRLDRPLELEYGIRRDMPGVVCGFYSAGLIHFLPHSDHLQIFSYGLPIEFGNCNFHRSIESSRFLFENILGIHSA